MSEDFELREVATLRRFLGVVFVILALPILALGVLSFRITDPARAAAVFLSGVAMAAIGITGLRTKEGTRARVTDAGLWIRPDVQSWFLFQKASQQNVMIPWGAIQSLDDGGVMYRYRRFTVSTSEGVHSLNTTFLNGDPSDVVDAMNARSATTGLVFEEEITGLAKRSGRWMPRDA